MVSTVSHKTPESLLHILQDLDSGKSRICKNIDGIWYVQEKFKQAISLYFSQSTCQFRQGIYDKIPLKFEKWTEEHFKIASIRVVPGALVRFGSFLAPHVVLMNCFVNTGVYIDSKTMVDSFATIGSCAQIGKNCHIASHVVIGGVLEPLNARPVIIEDNCFIGAHTSIVEGVLVRKGVTIGMGTHIGASTKIIERDTGKFFYKEIPENALVVPGSYTSQNGLSIQCAVILRYGKATQNTAINEDLRENQNEN